MELTDLKAPPQIYLGSPAQWTALAERARKAGVIGLDTEFYGLDVRKQSTVRRARVHVWSIALRSNRLSPYGYHRARGWVLPVEALEHPPIRALLEDPSVRKEAHNLSVDHHALENHGVRLAGARCTLSLTRWKFPQFVNENGRFGLKALMESLLHRRPIAEYRDVVDDQRNVEVSRTREVEVTECSCGVPKCRLRRGHEKYRVQRPVTTTRTRIEKFAWPLQDIVAGHDRWDLLVRYAAEDAVAALEIGELCDAEPDPAGWVYTTGGRPSHPADVDLAVIEMETVGIPVDTEYCRRALLDANADEAEDLAKLRRWYFANVGSAPLDGIDAIWSSYMKMTELFNFMKFPRSPVWKKGLVKRGETKIDQAALEWIARHCAPARELVDLLVHLKRVRAGKKYLEKLAASSGTVYPICGPAGDADERAGAVTGRLGVKGELEAQQLPSKEELDFYEIRRAIAPTAANSTDAPDHWRTYLQVHDEICLRKRGAPLVVADYSALEVVILADLCKRLFGDDQLATMTAPGAPDIHCVNARGVFGEELGWEVPERFRGDGPRLVSDIPIAGFKKHPFGALLRRDIKTIFYGLAYRKGAYGFQVLEDVDGNFIGERRAQEMLDAFRAKLPGVFRWHDYVTRYIAEHRGMYSLGGRWCPLWEETDPSAPRWMFGRAERRATNFPMQASAAEIVGDAMLRVNRCAELRDPATTAERAGELLRECMVSATANGTPLLVPLQVSVGIGDNYHDAK